MKKSFILLFFCIVTFFGCKQSGKESSSACESENWIQLFNGENLDDWEVKIAGYPVGENFGNTFCIEDGILKVNYDAYNDDFRDRFGHLFTTKAYSHYKLRMEYRFYGEHINNSPEWTYLNNGAMLHAQTPETMLLDQWFPVSIEAQILASDEKAPDRQTANVCTTGTEVWIDNEPNPEHCFKSSSKSYAPDEWVTMEIEVYGDSLIRHIVQGDTVLTYNHLRITPKDSTGTPEVLKSGRIAIQSEGHPTEFRKIELLDLSK